MIIENDTSRIIGDFLEINGDIIKREMESPFPKFISSFIAKKQRKKLINLVSKLENSDIILNIDNLTELFIYIYNNFEKGKYKSIYQINITDTAKYNNIEAIIIFSDYKIMISIDKDSEKFNIIISKKISNDNTEGCNVYREELSDKGKYKEWFEDINKALLSIISDYITEIISSYKN